ncbi:MAG: hypothetical protein RLZZ380_949 [Actinomycetota bacterium]|jgi:hypothetical protein
MTKHKFLALVATGALMATATFAVTVTPANAQATQTLVRTLDASKAGQFCKKADVGKKKRADNGSRIKCKMVNGRARWVKA